MNTNISKVFHRPVIKAPHIKRFVHDYSFPIVVTIIFLIVVVTAGFLRASQKASLAEILTGVTNRGQNYGTLLSKDKADELKKNDDTSTAQTAVGTPPGSPTSFAINPNTAGSATSSGGSTGSSGTSVPGTAVFSASIANFQQDKVTLECSSPKPKRQTCSKHYVYSATIRTRNGPGTVNYGWRSNLQSAIQDGTVSARSGDGQTTHQKVIVLDCNNAASVSLQFVLLSPSLTQSSVSNISHNCNEV